MMLKEYMEHDMGPFGKVRYCYDNHALVYDCVKGGWIRKPLHLISEEVAKDLGMSEDERDTINAVHRKLQGDNPPLENWEFIEFNIGKCDEEG